jgi:hypothetical protein
MLKVLVIVKLPPRSDAKTWSALQVKAQDGEIQPERPAVPVQLEVRRAFGAAQAPRQAT